MAEILDGTLLGKVHFFLLWLDVYEYGKDDTPEHLNKGHSDSVSGQLHRACFLGIN